MLWSTHVVWLTWLINVCFCVESSPIIVYISLKVMVVVLLLFWCCCFVSAQFVFPVLSKVRRRKSAFNLLLQSTFHFCPHFLSREYIKKSPFKTRAQLYQHLFNSRSWKSFFFLGGGGGIWYNFQFLFWKWNLTDTFLR